MSLDLILWIAGGALIIVVFALNQWRVGKLEAEGYWVPDSYRNAWLAVAILIVIALVLLRRFLGSAQ